MSFFNVYKKSIIFSVSVSAGCLIVFALAYFFVIMPQNQSKRMLNKELEKKKQAYESAQKAAQEETQKKAIEEINSLRAKLDNFTIDFRNSSSLTFLINQIARENSLNSLNIINKNNPVATDAKKISQITENHYEISFQANFSQFASFLNNLERNEPVLFVNKFSIVRSDLENELCDIVMDIASFIRTQPEKDSKEKYSEVITEDKEKSKS